MSQEIIIPATGRDIAIEALSGLLMEMWPGQRMVVTISRLKDKRSDAQNRALFGVAYPPIMEFMGLSGDEEKQSLHGYFCGEFWGWKEVDYFGKRKLVPVRSTTKNADGDKDLISKPLFVEFYNFVQRKSAEQGIHVPDPDKEWFLKEEEK